MFIEMVVGSWQKKKKNLKEGECFHNEEFYPSCFIVCFFQAEHFVPHRSFVYSDSKRNIIYTATFFLW